MVISAISLEGRVALAARSANDVSSGPARVGPRTNDAQETMRAQLCRWEWELVN